MDEPKSCGGCGKICYPSEKPVLALKQTWHPGCLKCTECKMVLSMKSLESANNKPYCRSHRPALKPTAVKAADSISVTNAMNAPKKKAEGLSVAHKGAKELAPQSKGDFGVNNSNIDQSTENKPSTSQFQQQTDQPPQLPKPSPMQKPAPAPQSAAPPPKPISKPTPSSNPAPPPPKIAPPPPVQEPVQEEQYQEEQQPQEEQPYEEQQPQEEQPQQGGRSVRALYDYQGENETDLTFKEGDTITVLDDTDPSGWFHGELNGVQGYFPSNFVE